MTLALAKSIVKRGKVDAAAASREYAAHYHGYRGYGESAHKVGQAPPLVTLSAIAVASCLTAVVDRPSSSGIM
jgi:hypothetical protein